MKCDRCDKILDDPFYEGFWVGDDGTCRCDCCVEEHGPPIPGGTRATKLENSTWRAHGGPGVGRSAARRRWKDR
jgi:hypothetical protein